MLYLIDGYNVTHSDPATAGLTLEEQRERLVARLRSRGAELLGPGRIVVVFDGAEATGGTSGAAGPVEVRFSRGGSADDLIVRYVGDAGSGVCLVTSDRELASRARGVSVSGLEVRGRESVYEAARGQRGRRRRAVRGEVGSLGVPPGGRRITEELEKLWLEGRDEG